MMPKRYEKTLDKVSYEDEDESCRRYDEQLEKATLKELKNNKSFRDKVYDLLKLYHAELNYLKRDVDEYIEDNAADKDEKNYLEKIDMILYARFLDEDFFLMAQHDKKGLSALEKALIALDDDASQEVYNNINPNPNIADSDIKR